MSASLRTQRVALYGHTGGDSGGYASDTYTRKPSTAPDGAWWASVATASGRESALGSQAQQSADLVLGFAAGVPVTADDVVRLPDGRVVKVTSPPLPRVHGTAEVQVTALFVDDAQAADFTLVEG